MDDAVLSSISAKISDSPIPQSTPAAPPEQPQAVTDAQPVEEAPNQQVEGADAPQIQPETEEPEVEIPLDQLEAIALEIKVKGDDGSDVTEKPTIKELREGYMRQKDYSRKTAEVARQREEVGEKVRQAIDSERNSYVSTLQQLHNVVLESVAPELKDVNWNHLASNEPAEYVRLRNRADQITQALGQIKSKAEEASKKQDADRRQALLETAKKSRSQLESDIPGFNDALYQSLIKTAETYGYKTEEASQWVDPRAIKLLNDAYQYQKLKSEKPIADKKVVNVPKVIKPGPATPNRATVQATEARSRFQKSGKLDDLAEVLRHKI